MKWTKETCKETALKYTFKQDFMNNDNSAYNYAYSNHILDDICSHMTHKNCKNYSKIECKNEANKYSKRTDFKKNSKKYYEYSRKNNWLDDICVHMIEYQKCKNYWTFDRCKEEALKCDNRSDFKFNSVSAYSVSHKNKWIDDVCEHMIYRGNLKRRCLYIYEFDDNSVYIGLTYDINIRNYYHTNNKKSQVYKYKQKTNLNYTFKQLTDYLDVDIIKKLEDEKIEEYRNNNYNILNEIKGGGIGGSIIKWTENLCKIEALKYDNKKDFYKNSPGAYLKCSRNGWMNSACSHMTKGRIIWNKEKCLEVSLKYNNKKDFIKNEKSAYNYAHRVKIFDEICSHMNKS
jgi:predicted GIY-YIG superfamily endonuclease